MNHSSNEVKQLLAKVCIFLARTVPPNQMVPEFLKLAIPMLVNGTKEKNSYVKANSELALVAVLGLRHGDEGQQKCMALLDVGAKESLSDVISKVCKKTFVFETVLFSFYLSLITFFFFIVTGTKEGCHFTRRERRGFG